MNIDQMKYFIRIVDAGSLNKAANGLYISRQRLRASLNSIENELGVRLLERTNRGVQPTPDGKTFYRMARNILSEYEQTVASFHKDPSTERTMVAVAISVGYSGVAFSMAINNYMLEHHDISVMARDPYDAIFEISTGALDIGFVVVHRGTEIESDSIVVTKRYTERSHVLLPANHPLASRKSLSLKEVTNYPIVLFQPPWIMEKGVHYQRIMETNPRADIALVAVDVGALNSAISSGVGIGFVPDTVLRSGALRSTYAELGLTTVALTNGFEPSLYCMINKDSLEKKGDVLLEFQESVSSFLNLKEID